MCGAPVSDLVETLRQHAPFRRIVDDLEKGRSCRVEGLWGSSAAWFAASLGHAAPYPLLCILPTVEEAEMFAEDFALFAARPPRYFPAWETLEADELPDADVLSQRQDVLRWLLAGGAAGEGAASRVIVAPVQAVLQPTPSPRLMQAHSLRLHKDDTLDPERLAAWLTERGFESARRVESSGEFTRRGGILDIFPFGADTPVRVEFFGDQIESLRLFDPGTQASLSEVGEVHIAAVPRRLLGDAAAPAEWTSLFDHLPSDCRLLLKEPADVLSSDHLPVGVTDPSATEKCREALRRCLKSFVTVQVSSMTGTFGPKATVFDVHSTERLAGDLNATFTALQELAASRKQAIVFCGNAGEKSRFEELIAPTDLPQTPGFEVRVGRLNRSFDWAGVSRTLIAHHELFNRYRQRRTPAPVRPTRPVESFYDLNPGDLVVHATHGIGIFRGMELIEKGPDKQDCMRIEYDGNAFLYVPSARIELVQKYIGPSEHRPPLSRLGSKGWLHRKEKAYESVRDLAAELLRLQALRAAKPGIAHPEDTDWQKEFEAAFPYEETEDQLRVAAEVKGDLQAARPMDRLICGDVGYGKTEIAMRAAFKAITGGRQVAVLVPTTVLAAQHTQTFRERMADYPVRVEMLSRFLTRGEQQTVLDDLAAGRVDVVIGTHRLVQPDVHFRDLGLVIIDEEQRFGVEHKENLKRLRETVDVLTLTATPIPRTLHMSLLGIRDIATLETPPRDRLAIHTRLVRFSPDVVRQAVLHEMSRGGQVFFVHNRVETIGEMSRKLRAIVPEARWLVGHGQMPERQLSRVMQDFVEHRADVLLCTTIIESGLDIPNANTILIDNADMFGLAELHQLRGRVGRYKHRAYAYMMVSPDRPLTPIAQKRLKAIEEFCQLGAGFRIAMRDLEIRGAGNILGPEQSGHLAAVGYDMYCRLIEQASRAIKNEPTEERPDVSISLGVEAFLPEGYVPEVAERIDIYRRIQRAIHPEELDAMAAELRDRFGQVPPPVRNLLDEALLRLAAAAAAILSLHRNDNALTVRTTAPAVSAAALHPTGWVVREIDATTLYVRLPRTRISNEALLSCLLRSLTQAMSRPEK